MNRLIVPPLPAASRPSNRITTFWPRLLDPRLQLEQLDLQPVFLLLVAPARQQVPVRVAAGAPVLGELVVGALGERAHAPAVLRRARVFISSVASVGRAAGEDVLQRVHLRLAGRVDALADGMALDRRRAGDGADVAGGGARARASSSRGSPRRLAWIGAARVARVRLVAMRESPSGGRGARAGADRRPLRHFTGVREKVQRWRRAAAAR